MAKCLHGLACCLSALPALAVSGPADLCRDAARMAAAETGVPQDVLMAVSLTETGRGAGAEAYAWPWTINMEGESHWFETAEAALEFARDRQSQGARSFDLGCFQLNHRWHGEAFASLDAMIDPALNARYAADFLARLYREMGDWSAAAGAYHSRTETYATRYRARFDSYLAQLASEPPRLAATPAAVRQNAFPLLTGGGGTPVMGSLVPLGQGG